MSALIQELLAIRESNILTERVDNMLDRLRTHFANENNSDPVKAFSKADLQETSYQLAGLSFILDEQDISKKIPELSDKRLILTLFNELDEPRERKAFNDRTATADEFLTFVGNKHNSSVAKDLLKRFEELKNFRNITANSSFIVRFISKLESKLRDFLKMLKG